MTRRVSYGEVLFVEGFAVVSDQICSVSLNIAAPNRCVSDCDLDS